MAVGRFESALILRYIAGDRAVLEAPLIYVDEDGTRYTVPAGEVTDLESTPRVLWSIFPKWGATAPAGVVHDWLCHWRLMDSDQAHALYRRALKAAGASLMERNAKFWAVKALGPNFRIAPSQEVG